jgi:hypothetical protein|tara:strand:- start:108 stop:404 length:297 start_codon:yes stop_codon:yes gene_type:complete
MSETQKRNRCTDVRAIEIYLDRVDFPTFEAAEKESTLKTWGQKVTKILKDFPALKEAVPSYSAKTSLTNDAVMAMIEASRAKAADTTPLKEGEVNDGE